MVKRKTHKTGKTKLHKGKKINEYSDGCWRYEKGALAVRSPHWGGDITSETAGAMQKRGQEVIEAKKQAAILRRAKEHLGLETTRLITLPADVAAEAAAELYMEIFEHDHALSARVSAYKEIGADVGFIDKTASGKNVQTLNIVNITISDKATKGIEEEDQILDALWEEI